MKREEKSMPKTMGILGGTSPESTVEYYTYITREYVRRYGTFAYPEILIYSVSFQKIVDWSNNKDYESIVVKLSEALNTLHRAGADFGLIAAVTLHIVYDKITANVEMPLLSIIDCTAERIRDDGLSTVGLLGTRTTMTEIFFMDGLRRKGINAIVPDKSDQQMISDILYNEVAKGVIKSDSRDKFVKVIETLKTKKAEGIILGCTEIPLIVNQDDSELPLYNTTEIHANAALEYSISED
jgi:aspartate racemase